MENFLRLSGPSSFFRVSSLAYPNLFGKKGYVVVVVVVVVVVWTFVFQAMSVTLHLTEFLQQ